MTVSSHLTPEPERRLWIILEDASARSRRLDWQLAAVAALAAVQQAATTPSGWLTAAVVVGLAGFSPLSESHWLRRLDETQEKPSVNDRLVEPRDIVKHSRAELILRLDRYLGGGITATQYYEDIVGRILDAARLWRRKKLLFAAQCALTAAGQLALF